MRFRVNQFDLVELSAPRPLPKWLPPTGGLLAATAVAFFACRPPLAYTLSWGKLIISSVELVLEVIAASALTVWVLCSIPQGPTGLDTRRLVLRTTLDALWLAPLALFIRENSVWAAVIAAVFAFSVVKSFRSLNCASVNDRGQSPTLALNSIPFSLLATPSLRRQFSGAGAAMCAQTAALAVFAGYPSTAAALLGVSSGIWTWAFTNEISTERLRKISASQPMSRDFWRLTLAALATAAALIPYLQRTYGIGGHGLPSPHRPHLESSQGYGREPGPQKLDLQQLAGDSHAPASGGNPGVILLPEKTTRTRLIAPSPMVEDNLLTNQRSSNPLVIPFEGVYWFFKAPDTHPPRTSRQTHGSPELLDIRSTDRRPLSMEAHENLGSMIGLDCCSRIQIAIRNADHYPETVSLELVLIDSRAAGKPSQSLGRMMVKSTRPWKIYDGPSPPASETLNYLIPAHPVIRRFDEVSIVFRIDAARADAGPKIAIDRFVLVPRGL